MRTRTVLVLTGVMIMGYAVAGALTDPDLAPAGVLLFLAGVLIAHDVLWMPVVLAVGAAITRLVPRRRRPVVIAAMISAAAVMVVAAPLVLGFGRPADNPSALPSPYGRNLALVLLVIAVVAALWRRVGGLALWRRAEGAASLWRRRAGGRKESERHRRDARRSGDG